MNGDVQVRCAGPAASAAAASTAAAASAESAPAALRLCAEGTDQSDIDVIELARRRRDRVEVLRCARLIRKRNQSEQRLR